MDRRTVGEGEELRGKKRTGDKLDFRKEYRDLYLPGRKPALVEVPPISFLMVDGVGAPESESYQEAMNLLYTVGYAVKMSKMGDWQPEGYVDFVVPPLESLWRLDYETGWAERDLWEWTSMLRMPEFVTDSVLEWARETAAKKKPDLTFDRLRLETYDEGLCVQILHVGPYAEEWSSMERILAYEAENDLENRRELRHHEIYLSDPRRTAPEKLRTVLRHPVRRG